LHLIIYGAAVAGVILFMPPGHGIIHYFKKLVDSPKPISSDDFDLQKTSLREQL
jgi:hypothetical protein